MSIDLDGTTDRLESNTGLAFTPTPLTIAFRVKRDTLVNTIDRLFTFEGAAFNNVISIYSSVNDDLSLQFRQGGVQSLVSYATGLITFGTWHSVVIRFHSTTTWSLDLNGVNYVSVGTIPGSLVFTNTYDKFIIGGRGAGQNLDGRMADVGIWTAALSDRDVAAYMSGVTCLQIRPSAIYETVFGLYHMLGNFQAVTVSPFDNVALNPDDNPVLQLPD